MKIAKIGTCHSLSLFTWSTFYCCATVYDGFQRESLFQGSFEDGAFKQKTPHPTGLHSPQLHHCVLENDWTDTIRCPTTRFHISLIHGLSHPNISKAFLWRPKPNARRTIICHKRTWHTEVTSIAAPLWPWQTKSVGIHLVRPCKESRGQPWQSMCRKNTKHAYYMMCSWRGLGW